jgi:hypothetical protein
VAVPLTVRDLVANPTLRTRVLAGIERELTPSMS